MTPRVVEDGDAIVIPVEGLSVGEVSVAIRLSTADASILAEALDTAVENRIFTESAEWRDGISMRDVMKAEAEGSKLRYMDGRKVTVVIRGLRPCPFCGHRRPQMDMRCDRSLDHPRIFKRVRCRYCCAQTPESAAEILHHVEMWNRRAGP